MYKSDFFFQNLPNKDAAGIDILAPSEIQY